MVYEKRETLLNVKDVSLKLDGNQILRDINFEIKDIVRPDCITGQVVALIGQSGAGKSTLFNLMSGIYKPDTGSITRCLFRAHTATEPAKDGGTNCDPHYTQQPICIGDMGVVYQNYYLFDWRKIRSLFTFAALKNPTIKPAEVKDAVEGIAADFNLTDHLDKYPRYLSGGQRQRAAIAEQILAGSEFLLLDEPFSGLDMIMIDKVLNILVKVSSYDELKTLVIVSHDIANTIAIADTVYILAKQPDKKGATIVKEIDLIERGLAWHSDVKDLPQFRETLKEIKSLL